MKTANVQELRSALESDAAILIDVREYAEHAQGHIPGSRSIPLRLLAGRAAELQPDRPVYLACQAGVRSKKAVEILRGLGRADAINVEGGYLAWQSAGFASEKSPNPPWTLERQVRLTAGAIILVAALLARFVHGEIVWVCAAMGAGLSFAAITNSCAMAMVLARMPWNQAPTTAPSQTPSGVAGT